MVLGRLTLGKKVVVWLAGALLVIVLYLFLWPVPIEPIAWEPKRTPGFEGEFAENHLLQGMELFATPDSHGPEDVAIDAEGRIYVGVEEGRILQYAADGSNPRVFADTGGRPLGLDLDRDGNLVVADALKGLLSIDPSGAIEVLCTEAGDDPLGYTDDVDVDSQNIAWFSDASSRWKHPDWMNDLLESAPNGRLLKYDINTSECSVVLDQLFFANGVAVSHDESYILVADMNRYRIKRVYVRGPRTGDVDVFIDNLPGFPDGVSAGEGGVYWLAIVAPRNELLDSAGPTPWLRKLLYRIPAVLQPKPARHPAVLGLDSKGRVVHNLQDADGADFSNSTSVEQAGEWLYVGSHIEPNWGRIRVSRLP